MDSIKISKAEIDAVRFEAPRPPIDQRGSTAANQDCMLLRKLPLEVLLYIYGYVFTSEAVHISSKNHVCSSYAQDWRDSTDTFGDRHVLRPGRSPKHTAIFRTCREIYREALPVFYKTATLHFPMAVGGQVCLQTHSEHMQKAWNVSFSYIYSTDEPLQPWASKLSAEEYDDNLAHDHEYLDETVAACVNAVATNCQSARNITFHIIPGMCCDDDGLDAVATAVDTTYGQFSRSQTATACAALVGNLKMKRIKVVGFSVDVETFKWVFKAIMEARSWAYVETEYETWPYLRLYRKEKLQLEDLRWRCINDGEQFCRISVWDFGPMAFKEEETGERKESEGRAVEELAGNEDDIEARDFEVRANQKPGNEK